MLFSNLFKCLDRRVRDRESCLYNIIYITTKVTTIIKIVTVYKQFNNNKFISYTVATTSKCTNIYNLYKYILIVIHNLAYTLDIILKSNVLS